MRIKKNYLFDNLAKIYYHKYMSNFVSLEYLNDYNIENLKNAIENGFQRCNIKSKLKAHMKVLIKVCLPSALSQDLAETTHPAVVQAIVEILSKIGVKCIVADSPYGKYDDEYLSSVYLNSGMLEMANLTTCELNHNLSVANIKIPSGVKTKGTQVLDIVNEVDYIINVGKLKMDENLGVLGSTSNLFGLIPGDMKKVVLNRLLTVGDFNEYIIDLHEALKGKILLNVLDAVVALEANKTQRMLNCLAMSENSYALDASICDLLNIELNKTIFSNLSNRNLIEIDKAYKLIGEKLEKFKQEDFKTVEVDNNTEFKQKKGYFRANQQRCVIKPNSCKGCKICSKICPTNAIKMKYDNNNELYAEIDYKKCIFCNKCLTACPYSVVQLKTPLNYNKLQKNINKFNKKDK